MDNYKLHAILGSPVIYRQDTTDASQVTPGNCRLEFKQCSVKPRHPTHHRDWIWLSTGTITTREPLQTLPNSSRFLNPPVPPGECRKCSARRSEGGNQGWWLILTAVQDCLYMQVVPRRSLRKNCSVTTFPWESTLCSLGVEMFKQCVYTHRAPVSVRRVPTSPLRKQ